MSEETIIIDPKTEMLNKAGLNWKVNSEPLQTVSGILIPDRIALVREDTQKVLGIHTEQYVPYQNDELLELLFRISGQSGLQVHTGGSFKGGEKVWFQLKSEDLKLGDDTIKGYISGFNSFDGRTSLAFGTSNVTVSCMNSFWRGYKQVDTKLRHSSTMKPRIEEILRKIEILLSEEQDSFREIERLADVRMTKEVKDMITRKLFDLSNEETLDVSFSRSDDGMSTNKKNKLVRFGYDLGLETSQKGETLWGLFSGVTRYTTHSMKRGDNSESKMFGRTGNLERSIYSDLVEIGTNGSVLV
jgi:phage/plasmid-like protein (TIGR03299 family)